MRRGGECAAEWALRLDVVLRDASLAVTERHHRSQIHPRRFGRVVKEALTTRRYLCPLRLHCLERFGEKLHFASLACARHVAPVRGAE